MRMILSAAIAASALAFAPNISAQPLGPETAEVTASTPGKAERTSVVKVSALVQAIDPATRTVTLKGPKGNTMDIVAGPEVKNFDQIKVGDLVVVRYIQSLVLELKKNGQALRARTESEDSATAKPGERPGVAAARTVTAIGDVTKVDPKTQTVTVRGPKRTVNLHVKDPKQFALIKTGDQIEATYTEAAAVSVEPAPAQK